jgi:PKD repeat protein
VTSNPALLTVNAPPTIKTQPKSQSVKAGATVTFTVVATGTPTLTYQWTFDGTAIPGATASTLMLTNVGAAAAGSYSVTVTNSIGNVTSNTATLKVH